MRNSLLTAVAVGMITTVTAFAQTTVAPPGWTQDATGAYHPPVTAPAPDPTWQAPPVVSAPSQISASNTAEIPCSSNLVGNKAACLNHQGNMPIIAGRCNGYDVPVIGTGPRGWIMPHTIGLIVVPDSCSTIQLKDSGGTVHTLRAWDWRNVVRATISADWSLNNW